MYTTAHRKNLLRGPGSWLALVVLTFFSGAGAQERVYPTAAFQDPLNNVGGSARATALGKAFAGVADDASAILWNPAGLSAIETTQVFMNHSSWLVGTFQESLTAGINGGPVGSVGLSINYVGYGPFEGRDESGFSQTDYTANQLGFGFGWGKKIIGDLSIGLSFLAVQQNLAGNSNSLLGADAGLLLRTKSGWGVGLSYERLGLNENSARLEPSARLGLSKEWKDRTGTSVLVAGGGKFIPPNGVSNVQLGSEFTYQRTFSLRAGYDLSLDRTGIVGLQGLTAGAGFILGPFHLDYAFIPYGELGNVHMVSLGYVFEKLSSKQTAPAVPVQRPALQPPVYAAPTTVYVQPSLQPTPTQVVAQVVPQAVGVDNSKRTITMEFEVSAGEGVLRAKALAREGKWRESVEAFKEILRKDPRDAVAWRELGNVYFQLGQKPPAVQCFENFLKLRPEDGALADWLSRYKSQ